MGTRTGENETAHRSAKGLKSEMKTADDWMAAPLGALLVTRNNKAKQIKSTEYSAVGSFPIVDQSADFICGYHDDSAKLIDTDLPLTIFGDHTRHTKFVDFPFIAGADGTQLLKPKHGIQDKFFYYLVASAADKIGNFGYDRHLKHLKEYVSDYPLDESEQAKIAEILSTVDCAIEQTETLIAKQQRIKTGLMQDLLTRGIDEHGNLRTEQTHKFKDTPLGRVPVEWKVGNFGLLAEKITKGESPGWQGFQYQSEGVLFITSENVRDGFLDIKKNRKYIPLSFHEKIKRSALKKGDILINLVGASIARTAIFDGEETSNINQAVCLLRLGGLISSGWFSFYLQMSNNVSRLLGEQVETARANLSLSDIRNFVITIPKIEEQRVVESIMLRQDQVIEEQLRTLEKTRALKTALMQDLLTGKKRVTPILKVEKL